MKKILISFIGTGRPAQGEEEKEYQKARYLLPEGSFQDSTLVTSVLYNYLKPDKLVVIGTPDSIWSELSKIAPELLEKDPLYEEVLDATWFRKMNEDLLKKWEDFLKKQLGIDIKLFLINSNSQEAEDIFDILYSEIPENIEEVYLDITHAFRHFPMIAAFSLPVLKYIKNFKNLNLIYGKLVKYPQPSPIIFMKTPNRLLELLEAISLTENSGNFEKFADIFDEPKIKELYLKVETNRRISNQQLNKLAQNLPKNDNIQRFAAQYLTDKVFQEIKGENLALRMAKRALFFAQRNQFLKAYTLIYEAILNTQPTPQIDGTEKDIYDEKRMRLESSLNSKQRKTYHTIRLVRNAIAHGSEPKDSEIKQILANEEELKRWVYEGYKLVEELINNT
jgi:cell division protein DivIC